MVAITRLRLFVFCAVMCALVGGVISAADAGLFGLFGRSKKKTTQAAKQSLVVFPFDQVGVAKIPDSFGQEVASSLRDMLSGAKSRYNVYLFQDRLPPIARAKTDSVLKPPDCTPPFAEDVNKSLRIAQILSTDYFLVGSIDDYKIDVSTKSAQMTLRAQLYVSGNKSAKLVKTMVVTGRSPESTNATDEEEIRALAAGDAVTKLIAELEASPEQELPKAAAATRSGTGETAKSQ